MVGRVLVTSASDAVVSTGETSPKTAGSGGLLVKRRNGRPAEPPERPYEAVKR